MHGCIGVWMLWRERMTTLTKCKEKNQVRLELDVYFDQLILTATSTDFQVSTDEMQMYITGPTFLKTKMHMLQDVFD